MRKILLLLLLLPALVPAQQRLMTIEEASGWSLYPRGLRALTWRPGTQHYSWHNDSLFTWYDAATGKASGSLSLAQLNTALTATGNTAVKTLPVFSWADQNRLYFTTEKELQVYNLAGADKKIMRANTMPDGAEETDLHTETLTWAYVKGSDLYVLQGGVATNISNNSNPQIQYGKAAHRSEFGITKGTFWSPKGSFLAFYRMDEQPVTDVPYMDITTTPVQDKPFKYPMAGQATHLVSLGVYQLKGGNIVYLKTPDPKDTYLTNISWDPEERYIYIAQLNREQNHLKLVQYDARTGEALRTLFEEKDEQYVEPEHGLYFLPGKTDEFLWLSERDGWQHLYHYRTDGTLLRQLTKGQWEVTDVLGFDEKGETVYFEASKESPLERQGYALRLAGKPIAEGGASAEPTRITSGAGTHHLQLSPKGTHLLDTYTSTEVPQEQRVVAANGKTLRSLKTAENKLTAYPACQIELSTLQAEDGTTLYTRTLLPANFDPNKKYPALVYVYNGPHVQLVTNSWLGGASLSLYFLAQQGYVVFTLDGRGSMGRGLNFEQATHRQLGKVEITDQMVGVRYLKGLNYVDSSRVGVHGWSYGGYMTTSLLTREPGAFACGIAGAPVIDWKYYEIMYTERYMDTPQTNPEGYRTSSALTYAHQLKKPLLLIHGTADDVVVWQHTLNFLQQCISAGTMPEYFVYPGHKHHVAGPDRMHLNKLMFNYLERYLKPASTR